jgi:hypothetical protein
VILIEQLIKIYYKKQDYNSKELEKGVVISLDLLSEILIDIKINNNKDYNVTKHTINIITKELTKYDLLDKALNLIKDWSFFIEPTTYLMNILLESCIMHETYFLVTHIFEEFTNNYQIIPDL